jgi:signal transduction histidine kinase
MNNLKKEIWMVHFIVKELQTTMDIDEIIHVSLTGITAGYFLGFSRAFIMLYDKEKNILYGEKGIGPFDQEEAGNIWSKIESEEMPIEKFFENGKKEEIKNSRFNIAVKNLKIDINELSEENYFKKVLKEKKVFVIHNVLDNPHIPSNIKQLLYPSDAIISPLFTENKLIGVIFADNSFHRKAITEEIVNLFSIISIHTALSLENFFKYKQIKDIQKQLIEKEKFATLGKVASYITHEVKNPIVTIGGFSKQILETDDMAKIKRNAEIIYKEILRLEKTIDNIINFSTVSPISYQEIDISTTIEKTIEILKREIEKKKIEICNLTYSYKIKCDPIQIEEVFLNIIQNAVENSFEYGKIEISSEIVENFLKIKVKDRGKGIDENMLEKVMDPFFTTKKKGLGLGLAISKEIIERHDGRIEIESKVNEGTIVNIYLPMEVKNEE